MKIRSFIFSILFFKNNLSIYRVQFEDSVFIPLHGETFRSSHITKHTFHLEIDYISIVFVNLPRKVVMRVFFIYFFCGTAFVNLKLQCGLIDFI